MVDGRTVRIWGERFTALTGTLLLLMACGGRSSRDGYDPGSGGSGITLGGASGFGPSTGGSFSTGGTSSSTGGTASAGCAGKASGSGGSAAGYSVVNCGDGQLTTTRISGVVRDPAGRVELYNVLAFLPGAELPPLSEGAECERCAGWGSARPIAVSVTDIDGRFSIVNAPAGVNVPVVIQVGKWRREVVLPEVYACVDNLIEEEWTRLPRSQAEGHLPRFAVTAGDADSMECFLRRVGIADEEFTTIGGTGRVHLFEGCAAGADKATVFAEALGGEPFASDLALLGDQVALRSYDAVLLGCENGACATERIVYVANVKKYVDQGGRLFLGHLQQNWLDGVGVWRAAVGEIETPFVADILGLGVNMTFPKGYVFADWLVGTGASQVHGELDIHGAHLMVGNVTAPAQPWLQVGVDDNALVPAVTFETPIEASDPEECGRVTVTDFHVSSAVQADNFTAPFPEGCVEGPLSPQELALEFLLFDQNACVEGGGQPPSPPPPGGCGP